MNFYRRGRGNFWFKHYSFNSFSSMEYCRNSSGYIFFYIIDRSFKWGAFTTFSNKKGTKKIVSEFPIVDSDRENGLVTFFFFKSKKRRFFFYCFENFIRKLLTLFSPQDPFFFFRNLEYGERWSGSKYGIHIWKFNSDSKKCYIIIFFN